MASQGCYGCYLRYRVPLGDFDEYVTKAVQLRTVQQELRSHATCIIEPADPMQFRVYIATEENALERTLRITFDTAGLPKSIFIPGMAHTAAYVETKALVDSILRSYHRQLYGERLGKIRAAVRH